MGDDIRRWALDSADRQGELAVMFLNKTCEEDDQLAAHYAKSAASAALYFLGRESQEFGAGNDHGEDEAGDLTVRVCGPQNQVCKCNCPESCEHVWDGPDVALNGGGGTVTCSRCGMWAISHSLWVSE